LPTESPTVLLRKPSATAPITLPEDLLRKVRGRVRITAALVLLGVSLDPLIVLVVWLTSLAAGPWPGAGAAAIEAILDGVAVVLSITVWLATRSPRLDHARLMVVGHAYEILLCLVVSLDIYHQSLRDAGEIPHLTWVVPILIFFSLLIPAPPRRTLWVAVAAAAMAPLSLGVLRLTTSLTVPVEAYVHAIVNPALAIVLATFGARVVYGLSLEVAEARRLGSYELVDLVGRGGMGEVWRAHHRFLARPAAIKLIPPEVLGGSDPGARAAAMERFEREAQVTASLRSPHTVEIYDFGTTDDGSFYYVMELLDGMDAHSLVVRHGPLPAERVVHLLVQACHSLGEAHAQGLVHRDVKPANLLVCRHGPDTDVVKVVDFGLVKATSSTDGAGVTGEHAVGGTPAFMAPEQARGEATLDGRADLYALGCVATWLLTGRLVFDAPSPLAMISHHLQRTPVPPSAMTELEIPPELDAVILACLDKDPAARPWSAEALAARLREVPGAHDWTPAKAAAWWDHRPTLAASPAAQSTRTSFPTSFTEAE